MTVITRMIGSRRRVHVGFRNPVPWPERSSGGVGPTRNRFGLWQSNMYMCQSPDFSQLPVRLGRPFLPNPRKIMLPSELARPSARIIQVREYAGGLLRKLVSGSQEFRGRERHVYLSALDLWARSFKTSRS